MNKNFTDNPIANIVLKPFELLADGIEFVTGRTLNEALKKIEKSNDHMVAQVGFQSTFDGKPRYVTDINGEKHKVYTGGYDGGHAWTIKKVEGDNVTIINPWNSSKEITVSRSEILSNAYDIEYLDLSEDQ